MRKSTGVLLIAVLMIATSCGGSGGTATQFDSQDLNDNSAEIQTNANNAEVVFVGTITAIGTAPGFWSGIAMSTQAVTYDIDEVLKGAYTESELTINHMVVDETRQADDADAATPALNSSIFAVGNQLIVFSTQNTEYTSLGTDYEGPEYIDVDANYGTIPYSSQNQSVVEGMIANPTASVAAASYDCEYEDAAGDKTYLLGKTLTVNGSAADQTSWNTMLEECEGMSSTLSDLVSMIENSETWTVTINLVNGEEGIFVDSFNGKKVDVKDLADWDLNGCNSKTSRCQLFAHILQEYWHAAVTGDGYGPSHESAIQHENQVRSDLGKTTTLTGHSGVRQGGNLYCQTTYDGSTELVQITDGTGVGPVTVQVSPPAAPSGLAADGSVSCRITLTWTDNADNEGGYQVQRKGGASPEYETLDVAIAADATSWANTGDDGTGLIVDQEFCYRIRAWRTVDGTTVYSSWSNEACATKQ
jgi:hypothetical protein